MCRGYSSVLALMLKLLLARVALVIKRNDDVFDVHQQFIIPHLKIIRQIFILYDSIRFNLILRSLFSYLFYKIFENSCLLHLIIIFQNFN